MSNRTLLGTWIMLLAGLTSSYAQKADFEILKYNHPGLQVDLGVGLWGWPLPMDYDGDGDMDLLVSSQGKPYNGTYLFENKTGAAIPVFAKPVWLSKSIKDIQVSYIKGNPRFTVPGAELLNFSKRFTADKRALFDVKEIIKDIKGRNRFNQWKLVDFDNDGDEDILVGVDDWIDYGWDNAYDKKGNWTNGPLHGFVYLVENQDGKYVNKGRLKSNGKDLDVFGAPTPNMEDFDGDGDLDLICGEFLDKLTYFENIGTRTKPVFAAGQYLKNDKGLITMDLEMIVPVAVDWNKDGFVDLVVGDEDGRVALIENTGKLKDKMPQFKSPVYFQQEADDVKFGALASPFSVDWDGDGDEDLICGNSAGYIGLIENLGMYNGMPRWANTKFLESDGKLIRIQAGKNASIQGPAEAKWGYTTLSVADWDGDGLLDIIANSIWGKVVWYKNIGTKKNPKLAKEAPLLVDWGNVAVPKPAWNWWDPAPNTLVTQWRTTPYVIDWNKDGLNDLVMLDTGGYLSYFKQFKKGNERWLQSPKRIFHASDFAGYDQKNVITDSLPGPLRLNNGKFGQSGRRKFAIADWDGDGKLDILVNSVNATWLKQIGQKDGIAQFKTMGPLGKLVLAGHDTAPTMVHWSKDQVPDLLLGAEDGHFYWLKNPRH